MPEVKAKPADKVRPYVSRNKIRRVMEKFPMYAEIIPPDISSTGKKEDVSVYADFINFLLDTAGNFAGGVSITNTSLPVAEEPGVQFELLEVEDSDW